MRYEKDIGKKKQPQRISTQLNRQEIERARQRPHLEAAQVMSGITARLRPDTPQDSRASS